MLRVLTNACVTQVRSGALTRVSSSAIFGTRHASDSVVKASAQAKAEAKKALDEIVNVLGPSRPFESDENPVYDEAFFEKWTKFFDRPNIDSWEIRRGIHVLCDFDTVPHPTVIIACLKACRRLNDFALAIRFLEVVREKQGFEFDKINPWIEQEIGPTMKELGIPTLEELGYHVPELAYKNYDDIH